MAGQIADTRALQLQISASTELLIRNLKTADQAVASFAREAETRLSLIDRTFASVGGGVTGLVGGLAAAASVGSLISLGKAALDYASSLDEVSQQVGVTARDLQVYRYAASQAGISQEEMDAGLQKFTKSLSQARAGVASATGVFHALGFSAEDIKHLDTHEALLKTADGIAAIKDRASRAAPEVALFGKAGQQLDTLLSGGSGAINELAKAANDLGLVLSHDQIENADRTADKLSELKQVLEANIASFVADNAGAIYDFAEALEHLALKAEGFVRDAKANFAGLGALFDPLVEGGNSAFDRLGIRITSFHDQMISVLQGIDTFRNIPIDVANGLASRFKDQTGLALPDGVVGTKGVRRSDLAGSFDRAYKAASAKPVRTPDPKPDSGGKSYTDPAAAASAAKAAAAAAKAAEAARKREVDREKAVADEMARLDDAWLSARSELTQDAAAQASIARERLVADTKARLADVDSQVANGKLRASEAAAVRARIGRNAAIQADAINQRENIQLEREAEQLNFARLDDLHDLAGSESALATTAKARLESALRVLAAEKEAERARLQAIADDEARPKSERHYTQGDIDEAKQHLSTLESRYGGREAEARQTNASPLDAYRQQLHAATDDMNEALEGVEVRGLQSVEDGMLGLITGTESVASAFKKMATSIIADLARIEIEQGILSLIGGPGASGGGSLLGKLFGGGRASGGAVDSSKFYLVGEDGPEWFAPGRSGTIIPNGALATPKLGKIAGRGGGTVVHQHNDLRGALIDKDVYADMQRYAAQAASAAYQGAVDHTNDMFRMAGRPSLSPETLMAIITLPASAAIKGVEWTIDSPAQVNRSDWTKRRQVVMQPGPSMWSATADLVVKLGEANMLAIEAFLVDLEGQINSFRIRAVENPQLNGARNVVADGGGQSGRLLNLRGGVPGERMLRGHKLTVNDQMVMLMADLAFDAAGKAQASFKPSLRASPLDGGAVEVVYPTVLVSLAASSTGWSVAPGQQYQTKQLVLEEAF